MLSHKRYNRKSTSQVLQVRMYNGKLKIHEGNNLVILSSMQAWTLTFNMFPYERVIHDVTTVLLQNSLKLVDVIVLVGWDKVCHSKYLRIILVRFCFLRVKRVDARLHEPKSKKVIQAYLLFWRLHWAVGNDVRNSLPLWKWNIPYYENKGLSMGPLRSQFKLHISSFTRDSRKSSLSVTVTEKK